MSTDKSNDIVFSTIFVIIWVGSAIVTVNAKLLGGKMYKLIFLYINI